MISSYQPSSESHEVVAVRSVHKTYRRGLTSTPVLIGVDLTVQLGESLFLVGPSGSGKSTLLSILGCILTPDRGDVVILGRSISSLSDHQRTRLRRDRIGFLFQRFQLIRGLTALDNVRVPLTLRGVSDSESEERSHRLLDAVGMAHKARVRPNELSAGQCQRIALARALVGDPDLILTDEPTASLDAKNGQEIMSLLHALIKEKEKTVIVVTHDPRISQYADRICAMENGKIAEVEAIPS